MRFIDRGPAEPEVITIQQLKAEWEVRRNEDPVNTPPTFAADLMETVLATINGRNDMDVDGMTPAEVTKFINRLRGR